ncbi:MAG TPA: ABC transporter substrate-binding protein [Candidatus Acidoferrum sp.]|nr:ABC transporter substrate-binding protein [Candidatus Acidoferrum sp.]
MSTTAGPRTTPRWVALAAVCMMLGAAPRPATAGPATETLRPAIDQVLRVLDDPALKGVEHARERRAALRAVMETVVDFPDAARRALSVHWAARTEAEREEFVMLFKDLVTSSYIVTMEGSAGQLVVFVGEAEHDGITTVLTNVERRQGPPAAVEYRMHQRGSRWLVYDVIVEGVSLVGNYRTQFNTIVRTSSYAELIRRMRERVAELTAPPPLTSRIGPPPSRRTAP